MTDKISENKSLDDELKRLSNQADELIRALKRLQADNHHLRIQQDQISAEKSELQDRNRQAKQRIDLIVERLRTLEPE
ncbi:MAG: TIGR02449 family protein [Acidiferrobacteraceae bacterium]|nr:TIGR02449 family protein [Acidiferrobacteraceae bacterium]|tara:strand:+ start:2275 stop:2508 length:234 start_codon:yes stop_codon:yes gene_type:complete